MSPFRRGEADEIEGGTLLALIGAILRLASTPTSRFTLNQAAERFDRLADRLIRMGFVDPGSG